MRSCFRQAYRKSAAPRYDPPMCNRYAPPRWEVYYDEFRAMPPENLPVGPIFPRKPGPFIRAALTLRA